LGFLMLVIEKENKALQDGLGYLWQKNTVTEGTSVFSH
jgi:hypothetical protein